MIDIAIVLAVIIGISQVVKMYIGGKFIPLVNVVLGVAGGIFYVNSGDIKTDILTGIAIGLAASGLFDMNKIFKK